MPHDVKLRAPFSSDHPDFHLSVDGFEFYNVKAFKVESPLVADGIDAPASMVYVTVTFLANVNLEPS